jgi:WD40 repeat protein
MANRSGYSIILLFLIGMVISSCAPVQDELLATADPNIDLTPSPKLEYTIAPTVTPELKYTFLPTMTPYTPPPKITITPTLTPLGYSYLPDGEYILYVNQYWLEAISIKDSSQIKLLHLRNQSVYLSLDKKSLVLVPGDWRRQNPKVKVINLETMVEKELEFPRGCGHFILRNGDRSYLATCEFMEGIAEGVSELYSINLDGTLKVQKTNCYADSGDCGNATYSPDGQWISYIWWHAGAGRSDKVGLYLTGSDCIEGADLCDKTAKGPVLLGPFYAWSPDSRYIASDYESGIQVFEVIHGTIAKKSAIEISEPFEAADITWSPDSNWLAYTRGNEIRVVEINDGHSDWIARFNNGIEIIGWVKIKGGKVSP